MLASAYDTAWVARLPDKDFDVAREWLKKNQKADGSWGGQSVNFHDRIFNTFASAVTMEKMNCTEQANKGYAYISDNLVNLEKDSHKTFGFEFLIPYISKVLDKKRIECPKEIIEKYLNIRYEKIGRIPRKSFFSNSTTLLNYIELLEDLIPEERTQEIIVDPIGGLATSPSATAWKFLKTGDSVAHEYLKGITQRFGFVPTLYPVETSESSWSVFNQALVDNVSQTEMDFLSKLWSKTGMAFSKYFPVIDLDSTAMCFKALYGKLDDVNLEVFDQFEADESFVCYKYERVSSVGANIHLLDAIKDINEAKANKWKQKILKYLKNEIIDNSYWLDKWHLSPYYITSHAVIALKNIDDELMQKSVDWILKTQKKDGSWGVFENGTCEETAYCVLALFTLKNKSDETKKAIINGYKYLNNNFSNYTYPELWVGKVLYCHVGVVKSAIECAIVAGKDL